MVWSIKIDMTIKKAFNISMLGIFITIIILATLRLVYAYQSLPVLSPDQISGKQFSVIGPKDTLGKKIGGDKQIYWISCMTNSMLPTLNCSDILIAMKTNNYTEGDVVWFRSPWRVDPLLAFTLHRIVGVNERGYITKGDHNNITDQEAFGWPPIKPKNILFVIKGKYSR